MSSPSAADVSDASLYNWPYSSASYRVRIALALKGLRPERIIDINLRNGEQQQPQYMAVAPQGLVPALRFADVTLTQSLAIMEWLEEVSSEPPLLPKDPLARARVRAFALSIACDIHPINNPRVLNYLRQEFARDEPDITKWYRHWVEAGLAACERLVTEARNPTDIFCFGTVPTIADICLVPQLYNARRFQCDLSSCPTLVAIDEAASQVPAFAAAHPEQNPALTV
ncbi:maleylacetoacetate isomerase [Tardiphaga sp.]|uniref:maleylacetoacetate isomerase n=1 Tax=Tardiphaga sp. TaxID=1926292 RepID=UPI00352A2742